MNRAITPSTPTPTPTLRDAHVEATRARIIGAVAELLGEEHPAALSVPAVAERAGLSVRTVYRHFPTKEALIDAVAGDPDREIRAAIPGSLLTRGTVGTYLPILWAHLAQRVPFVRAQHSTPAGQAVRKRRLPAHRAEVSRALAAEDLDLAADDRARLRDLIILVTSSAALLELTEQMDHDVDEAAGMAVWAVDALVDRARRTKEIP